MMMIVLLAYRAILAEPRTKATAPEDYSGGASRGDYAGGNDAMNQYAAPMGMYFSCYICTFSVIFKLMVLLGKYQPSCDSSDNRLTTPGSSLKEWESS